MKFSELANVQTVGIGLYLALAVIQAISTTGIAGLTRRVATLRNAVRSAQMGPAEHQAIRRLGYDVSGLEIGFHDLNRRLLRLVFILFTISLIYFAYCTVWQDVDALVDGVWFIFIYYLLLPMLIFIGTTLVILWRCRGIAAKVHATEKRVRNKALGIP